MSPLDFPLHLYVCTDDELNYWLSGFVVEVRRKGGDPYPPVTVPDLLWLTSSFARFASFSYSECGSARFACSCHRGVCCSVV